MTRISNSFNIHTYDAIPRGLVKCTDLLTFIVACGNTDRVFLQSSKNRTFGVPRYFVYMTTFQMTCRLLKRSYERAAGAACPENLF
jgi:hypothetical protein